MHNPLSQRTSPQNTNFKSRILGWQPRSVKLQKWRPSKCGTSTGCTGCMFVKLVLSGEKRWRGFHFVPADLGKGIKVLLSSVSCKCQDEIVKFLATQKLCDFGNWELFLETQPRASSYSPSNNFINHQIPGNNSLSPTRRVQLQTTETTMDTVVVFSLERHEIGRFQE